MPCSDAVTLKAPNPLSLDLSFFYLFYKTDKANIKDKNSFGLAKTVMNGRHLNHIKTLPNTRKDTTNIISDE